MPIRVIDEYPEGGKIRRVRRGLAVMFGSLMVVVGLLASFAPVLYVLDIALVVFDHRPGHQLPRFPAKPLAIAVVGIAGGILLVRGRRRIALFLRRFHFEEATQAVTFALVTTTGAAWRLVTLDDKEVQAVGPQKGARTLFRGCVVLSILMIGLALAWVFGGGPEKVMKAAAQPPKPDPRGIVGFDLNAAVGSCISGALAFVFVICLVILFVGYFVIFGAFAVLTDLTIRRAEGSKAVRIQTAEDLEREVGRVPRRATRIFAPRLIVVKIVDSLWKTAVSRFAAASSAVVIDVSEPTENLLWEIESLKPLLRPRWVLIGSRDHLDRMLREDAGSATDLGGRLSRLLDGEEVLAYSKGEANQKRFARALRARLETLHAAQAAATAPTPPLL
jgi:hypothetical protein